MKNTSLFVCATLALGSLFTTSAFAQTFDSGAAVTPICPKLTLDLKRGDSDATHAGQVTELQTFLADYYDLSPAEYVTGFFGRMTEQNVRRFQGAQSLPSVGRVGPLTRAAIARVCSQTVAYTPPTQSSPVYVPPTNTYTPPAYVAPTTVATCPLTLAAPSCASSASPTPTYNSIGCITGWSCPSTLTTQAPNTSASCSFNGTTIAHGASVAAYASASVVSPASCQMQTRMCANGALSGSYDAATCTVQPVVPPPPLSGSMVGACSYRGEMKPEGANIHIRNTYQNTAQHAVCDNGTWHATNPGGFSYSDFVPVCGLDYRQFLSGISRTDFGCDSTTIWTAARIGPRHGSHPLTVTAQFRLTDVTTYGYTQTCRAYTLNWGDGTSESAPERSCGNDDTIATKTHTYTAPGNYTATTMIQGSGFFTPNPLTVSIRVD